MKKYVIIVAGGKGNRMQNELPKQFIEVGSKPIIVHTIEAFLNSGISFHVIVVMHPNFVDYWNTIISSYLKDISIQTAFGGPSRFYSVKNGLALINDEESIVAIHDAVRPLVSKEVISQCMKEAETYGNAIPAIPMVDSIRSKQGVHNEAVSRENLVSVQTPQCFKTKIIKRAYLQNFDDRFLDDAIVLERTGVPIHIIAGNKENIKITEPLDLLIAQQLLL